jgi:hypothetical protein
LSEDQKAADPLYHGQEAKPLGHAPASTDPLCCHRSNACPKPIAGLPSGQDQQLYGGYRLEHLKPHLAGYIVGGNLLAGDFAEQ